MNHLVHNTFQTDSSQKKSYTFLTASFWEKPIKGLIFSFLFAIGLVNMGWGQSIFTNPIMASNPSASNPYTNGQIVDPNLMVSGIGRGSGINPNAGSDRYNANGWNSVSIDLNKYFEFILTPNSGFEINFVSFIYTGQRSASGPISFAIRSSEDGFTSDIGTPTATGATISLTGTSFQNINSAITFRLYGWGASAAAGTFSVNSFTFNGTVMQIFTSTTNGDWNTGSTWVGGNVPPAGATVVINHNVTLATSLTNTGSVTVNTGASLAVGNGTYTNSGTTTINGTFQINQGGFATGGTWTYGAASTLVFNNSSGPYVINSGHSYWPAANGPFNVTVQNGGGIELGVDRVVNGTFLLVAGTDAVRGNALTLNGTTQINGGNFQSTPIYGANSTLIYNTNTTYGRNNEWNANGVGTIGSTFGYPNNVQISNNTTLNFPNGSNVNRACAGNLTIDSGSNLYADFGGGSVNLTVGGNFSMSGDLSLGGSIGGDMTVRGNWTRTGGTFNTNNRAVFFNGNTGSQTITGATTFDFVILDKSSGNMVLNNDITVNQTLTLTNGLVNTGVNKVILPNSGNIARTNGWINGNLQRSVNNGNNRFDVGTATVYGPATLNMSGVSGTVVTGNITLGTHPNEATSGIDVAKKANHYWTFTQSGGSFTSYTGTFDITNTTNTGNTADYKAAKFMNSAWSAVGGSTAGNEVTSATFTDFGDFIVGEVGCGTLTINITNNNGLALNCTTPSTTLTASGGTSYVWSTTETTASITVTTGETFIVTVTDSNGCTGTASVTTTLDNTPPMVNITNNNGLALNCTVPSTTLTASSGASYLWSTTETTQAITVSTAGTFTVTVTAANGCTAYSSVTTTLDNTPPMVNITNNNGLALNCTVPSTTLTASSGASYLWSTMETTQAITVSTAGTFTVTVTDTNGCTASSSVTTTLDNTPPMVNITNNNGLAIDCTVPSTTLTASSAASYLWSTMETTQAITVSTAGTFTVTVTAANGCTASSSVTTTLDNTPPMVNITNNNGLALDCTVPSTTLTASSAASYLWSTMETTQAITVSTAGTFTVTVTAANGCTASSNVTTTLDNTPPMVNITNNNGLALNCTVPSTTLTASSGSSYLWSTTETTQAITVSTAGTFTVTVTAANGCTASSSVTTTLDNTPPMVNITNNNGLALNCTVPSTTLTASSGASYLWSTMETTQAITVNTAGTFTVTVTAANGCTASSNVTTTLDNTPPMVNITNNNGLALDCTVPSTTLTASSGASYLWSTTETTQAITVSTAGTFTVTVTAANGCTASSSVTTTLDNTPPMVNITNINGLALNCTVPSTTLTASSGSSYLWSTTETTQSITVSTAGTFTVTVTAANGCTASSSVTTTLDNTPPMVNITNNNGLALDCTVPSTTLTASSGSSYLWSTTETTQAITVSTAGTFTVTVTDTNGCTASSSVTTTFDGTPPTVNITNNNGLSLNCTVQSTTLTASGGGDYLWNTGAITEDITVNSAGTFIVTVTDSNGCTASSGVTTTLDNTPPMVNITNNNGLALNCTVTSTTLTASSGASYLWSTMETTQAITVNTAGTFTVTVTAANGCTASSSVTTTLNNTPPTAGITNNSMTTELTCSVTSISVTATGGGTYLWNGGSTPMTANNTFSTAGTYTVTVTSSNGCTDSESITITQDVGLPVVTCPGNATYCYTEPTFTLTGGMPTDGDYTGAGVSGNNFTAATAGIGTHTITYTYTNMSNCSASCTFLITVQEFTTIASGDYNDPTTWAGGCVPPNPIPAGVMVNIGHTLTNTGTITNNGTIMSTLPFTNDGIYQGTGTFEGPDFINNGTFKPGN